jgi:hypothetical protein
MSKKTDWIILACLAVYSFLFWEQDAGLNFFLFSSMLIAGQLFNDRSLLRNRVWRVAAAGALISSFCVFWHSYGVCVFANIISLLLAGSVVVNSKNSWFGAIGLGMLNAFTAVAFIFIEFINRMNRIDGDHDRPKTKLKRAVLLICILIVAGVFFSLYRGSSILFESFTNKIDLSFISIGWCIFMAIGAVLLFAFFNQQTFDPFTSWDRKQAMQLELKERNGLLDKMMSLDSEYFSGIVLFAVLNLMLLLVNVLDVVFLFGGAQFLPEDVTYSQYVHQGINQLILSILFASVLIFYWFRNFHADAKQFRSLRWLAVLWVVQNIIMIIITIQRNHSYIYVFGLTYKRIGVDVYLLLAVIGLALVLRKVIKQRSNAFVVHNFGWACFAVLVAATPVNWDKLIYHHNVSMNRMVDEDYIHSLSETILPLQHERIRQGIKVDSAQQTYLEWKTFRFLTTERFMCDHNRWPSITIDGNSTYQQLMSMKDLAKDSLVDVSASYLRGIYFLPPFSSIKTLIAHSNGLDSIGEVSAYRQLDQLDIRYNPGIRSLAGIESCQNLRTLDLRGTSVSDYTPFLKMPNLRVVYVDYITYEEAQQFRLSNPKLEFKTN